MIILTNLLGRIGSFKPRMSQIAIILHTFPVAREDMCVLHWDAIGTASMFCAGHAQWHLPGKFQTWADVRPVWQI